MGLFTVKQTLVGLFNLVFKNKHIFFYYYCLFFSSRRNFWTAMWLSYIVPWVGIFETKLVWEFETKIANLEGEPFLNSFPFISYAHG